MNSEIRQISAFRGADGNFSAEAYKAALAGQGLSDAMVRDDLASGLLAQQIFGPAGIGVRYPKAATTRYAQLFKESRSGSIAIIPAGAFVPKGDPSDQALTSYYQSNRARFTRPERRVVRYAIFGADAVEGRVAPTDAEIQARYRRDADQYRARERRDFTQLVVPTKQAADAIAKSVADGRSLAVAASQAGLRTSNLVGVDKDRIAADASQAVADAYFAAPQGELTQPARSALGWQIARVDKVEKLPGQSLAAATPAIREALLTEKRTSALSDLAARAEEELDGGATLAEVAADIGVKPTTTAAITSDGQGYAGGADAPDDLKPVLATAFQMEEASPQVAQIPGENRFVVFEAARITPSAVAPLQDIRDDVTNAWRLAEGSKRAKAAADRVIAKLGKGTSLGNALSAEKVTLPRPQTVSMSRQELLQQQQRTPPPLALLFSMAQGTSKRLEMPGNQGWFVVDLDKVTLGNLQENDPVVSQIAPELQNAFNQELTEQAVAAMRNAVGVARNPNALPAVRKQLTGEN